MTTNDAAGMHGIRETIAELAVPIGELAHYPGNARRGDVGAITNSLRMHGQYKPITVRSETGEVLAGNHTLRAATELGWTHVAATYVSCTDEQAARIVLVDNRTNDLATYDDEALAAMLTELDTTPEGIAGTGFEADDLAALLAGIERPNGGTGIGADTEPVDPPAEPRTKLGDVWVLGNHRLACGDSTDALVAAASLGGMLPHMVLTDPPYGVSYASIGRRYAEPGKQHAPIENDSMSAQDTRDLFAAALQMSGLRPGGSFYATVPAGPLLRWFMEAVEQGLGDGAIRQVLIWVKNSLVMGRGDYHYRHEPIIYGWAPGAAHYFVDDRKQDTVWEFDRPSRSDEHPTMKPVPLFERALLNSTKPGQVVYDPFGGSGTTLLAAENLRRKACLVELDPRYCDVIVDRWERHTGGTATIEGA